MCFLIYVLDKSSKMKVSYYIKKQNKKYVYYIWAIINATTWLMGFIDK